MVDIKLNYKVNDVLEEKMRGGFDAVFIAIGAHIGKKTDIPAREAGKILDAVSFLKEVELGFKPLKNPVMLKSIGRTTSIKQGAKLIGLSLDEIKKNLEWNGYSILDDAHKYSL